MLIPRISLPLFIEGESSLWDLMFLGMACGSRQASQQGSWQWVMVRIIAKIASHVCDVGWPGDGLIRPLSKYGTNGAQRSKVGQMSQK